MLKGILFDVDGVLVDSEKIYFNAVRKAFLEYNIKISQDEFVKRWMIEQTETSGVIKDYELNVEVKEVRKKRDEFLNSYEGISIIPGARELLERFYIKYKLGAVSSAYKKDLELKLGRFDLFKYFETIITCEDVLSQKPNPECYIKGVSGLGLKPNEVLVIEDNPSGVRSGVDAGCKVIAYPNGFTSNLDFRYAHNIVKSLYEINEDLLEKLFK